MYMTMVVVMMMIFSLHFLGMKMITLIYTDDDDDDDDDDRRSHCK